MTWFFVFFFVSGFCSLLYEIVWLRLSMAQFGVTTALVSIVLSVFMAGLGLGSWASGRLLQRYGVLIKFPSLRLYALTECLIGVSAIVVPYSLSWDRHLLQSISFSSSAAYYLGSGILVAITIIPWCACMGATIPIAMFAIRQRFRDASHRSFSYLYLANVLGAVVGATVPLLIIELLGFQGTLKVGAASNLLLAIGAFLLSRGEGQSLSFPAALSEVNKKPQGASSTLTWLLFGTGLTSMAIEVVWIRQYTPYLGTFVYAFALILSVYLAATFLGSRIYRTWSCTRERDLPGGSMWFLLGVSILLPLIFVDPRVQFRPSGQSHLWLNLFCLIMGVAPFSGILGFVTPLLVDRWSNGDPDRAGRAYAINVIGCIVGPLLSGFLLLPLISERWELYLFAGLWVAVGLVRNFSGSQQSTRNAWAGKLGYAVAAVVTLFAVLSKDFSDRFWPREVLRDHTATIIAAGRGREKRLRVNGVGITSLTPVTKMMAHFPLASLDRQPKDALMICFGMGTTFRSLLSWDISTTAVELVPSVPRVFGYFHSDGPELLRSPLANVVIDDGRRYLERTSQQYDLVTLDPPPPVEAAGSSMLYSKEFYATIKQRLRPGGILQQWLPAGDNVVRASVARAIKESFPYVRVFGSVEGWGLHFLASDRPIAVRSPEELVERMPEKAVRDMMEWGPEATPQAQFSALLRRESTPDQLMAEAPGVPALQDDRPENEYFLLRHSLPERWSQLVWKQSDAEKGERSQASLH